MHEHTEHGRGRRSQQDAGDVSGPLPFLVESSFLTWPSWEVKDTDGWDVQLARLLPARTRALSGSEDGIRPT